MAKRGDGSNQSLFQQQICHEQAVGRRLGEGPGKSRAVADGVEPFGAAYLEILTVGAGGVVFTLDAVEQRVVVGGAGSDAVQGVEGLDDIVQLTLGKTEAQISSHGV